MALLKHKTRQPKTLLGNVSFHLLWSSTLASGMGDRLAMLAALGMLGFSAENQDKASIVAGIDFFFFLPYLFWSPIAGWLADRLPRKWLMFGADELRGLLVLSAFMMVPVGTNVVPDDHHWKIWLLLLGIGMMAATFSPCKLSIVPNVVGNQMLQRANAAVVTMGVIGNLLGFLIAFALGMIAKEQGVRMLVLASSLCYIVSGTFWAFLKTPWEEGSVATKAKVSLLSSFREIQGGMRYALSHKPIKMLIIVAALVWTGTSVYMPALGAINDNVYMGDEQTFYLLSFMVGFGMLLGGVLLGFVNAKRGSELVMCLGLIGSGMFIMLQMIIPVYGLGIVFSLGTGVFASILLIPLNTLLQRITPNYLRGRIFAAKEILTEIGKVLVSGLIWKATDMDDYMRPTTFLLAVLLILVAIWGIKRYVLIGPGTSKFMNLIWRITRLYADVWHRLKTTGTHHMPATGPVLLVANHTAGLDPTLIYASVQRPIRFLMAQEYMSRKLNWLWRTIKPVPVKRDGSDRSAVRAAVDLLAQGEVVGIFPEGGYHDHVGEIRTFHPGVGLIARKAKVPILPVFVTGTPADKSVYGSYFMPSHSQVIYGKPVTVKQLLHETQDMKEAGKAERIAEGIKRHIAALQP